MLARTHNPRRSKYSSTPPSQRPRAPRRSPQTTLRRSPRRRHPLPQEIIDRIIDCLKDQQDFLASCSTVSRAFVRRSQQHLFHSIILYPSLERKLKALLEDERSCHLANYVNELTVAISISNHTQQTSPLIAILPYFDHLKSLTIRTYGGSVIDWEHDILGAIHHAFRSVFVGNRLNQIVLQDIHNFNPLLPALCPSLQVLVIGGEGSLAPYTPSPVDPNTHLPSISALMIGSGKHSFQSLIDCSTSSYPCAFILDNLQWLSLRETSDPSWSSAFLQLARTSLSRLRHLVIELEIKSGEANQAIIWSGHVDLSSLENLTSIELRNSSLDHDQTVFNQRVARILDSLPRSCRLLQVILYCPGYQFANIKVPSSGLQWRDVDTALSFSLYLRQVHFKFGLNIYPLSPNLLPKASSRGVVLRVSKMLRPV